MNKINCECGHSIHSHHGSVVMNIKVPYHAPERGIYCGVVYQECEATYRYGQWLVRRKKDRCYCNHFKWDSKRKKK